MQQWETEDKTRQDAGCSGRRALGKVGSGMGVLSLVLNQSSSSRARVEQASKQRSVPLVVRCSAQHQEGPSRSCSASQPAVLVCLLAVPPPKSHGAARQLTVGRRALHTLIISRIIPARHAAWICTYAATTPSTGTVPLVDSARKGSRPTHRSFSPPTHNKRGSCARYIHTAS